MLLEAAWRPASDGRGRALSSSDRQEAIKPLPDRIDVEVGTQSKTSRLTKVIQSVERSVSLQQPHLKAARQLTPGQPADFRLGPIDTTGLFTGNHSFQLEVSENATRVIFTLESVDPDVDVDLYVRFGEDNEVQNGRVVSDYSSEGITGNERIVITPRSDPPTSAWGQLTPRGFSPGITRSSWRFPRTPPA